GVVTDSWNHRTFPQWAMWKPLTDYWARAAEVLEPGRPQTDVAIYRDGFITTAARITDLLGEMVAPVAHPRPHPLFDGEPLERAGYTLGYVDPVGVRQGQVRGAGTLFPRRSAYRALVVDERSLPARTAVALDRASAAGLQVVFVGTLPSRSPSGRAPAAEDRTVRRAVRRIRGRATTRVVAHQSDAAGALAAMGLQPAARWSTPAPLYTQRRTVGRDAVYYVWNAGDDTVRTTASFLAAGLPRQLDLWNGTITELAEYRQTGGRMAVPLTLGPGEATVFAFRGAPQHFAHVTRTTAQSATLDGNRIALTGAGGKRVSVRFSNGDTRRVTLPAAPAAMPLTDWKLQVQAALPTGTLGLTGTGLGDWRDQPALATASGVGTYTAKVTLPADFAGGATLDLGKIDGAAQVYLNDTLITRELSPDHPVDVGNALRGGDNTIRVVLSTTLRNAALAVLPVTTLSRPTFATNSTTQAYGLVGPVTLAPYARADIRRPHV
ncbi:MAG: hypothetical protein QOF76_77, partial [Solirubrobacteraceae bacterium]|nr:hypothetical protein [Solirubrobacteraceae bacterium]